MTRTPRLPSMSSTARIRTRAASPSSRGSSRSSSTWRTCAFPSATSSISARSIYFPRRSSTTCGTSASREISTRCPRGRSCILTSRSSRSSARSSTRSSSRRPSSRRSTTSHSSRRSRAASARRRPAGPSLISARAARTIWTRRRTARVRPTSAASSARRRSRRARCSASPSAVRWRTAG